MNADKNNITQESLNIDGVTFLTNPHSTVEGNEIIFDHAINVRINNSILPNFVPTECWDVWIGNSKIVYTEPDKLTHHIKFESDIVSGSAVQGTGVDVIEISGGTFSGATGVNLSPRVLSISGAMLNGATMPGNFQSAVSTGVRPEKVSVTNSFFQGKNNYNDFYVGMLKNPGDLTVDGTNVTVSNNKTITGPISQSSMTDFLKCIEVGATVRVTASEPDGVQRFGIVQSIYGGISGMASIDFQFNTILPSRAVLSCLPVSEIYVKGNHFENWVRQVASQFNSNPPFPWAPTLNFETFVTENGNFLDFNFDSTFGKGQLINVYGTLKKITVNVKRAYTGRDTSPSVTIERSFGAPGEPITQRISLARVGTREITDRVIKGSQAGDSLSLLTGQYVDQANILTGSAAGTQQQLSGSSEQQALYEVIFELQRFGGSFVQ